MRDIGSNSAIRTARKCVQHVEKYLENIKTHVCHYVDVNVRPQRTFSLNKYIQKKNMDAIIPRTKSGEHCLSVFHISFINSVIKDTFLLEFSNYKTFIRTNFNTVSANFIPLFTKITNEFILIFFRTMNNRTIFLCFLVVSLG